MSIINLEYLQCQDIGRDLKEIRSEIQNAKYNQLLKDLESCQKAFFGSHQLDERDRKWFKINA